MEKKVHYKLHKVKKQWVTIAVASVALATVLGGLSVTTSSLLQLANNNNDNPKIDKNFFIFQSFKMFIIK